MRKREREVKEIKGNERKKERKREPEEVKENERKSQ